MRKRTDIVSEGIMSRRACAVFVVLIFGLCAHHLNAQEPEREETYRQYVFKESETVFQYQRSARTRFVPGVSSFGSGGIALYTMPSYNPLSWQFGIGLFSFNDVPDRHYRGTLVSETVLALPLYTGIRYDLYRAGAKSIHYTVFSSFIGGPVIGMGIPDRSGFTNSLEAAHVRWGAGGQAALGIEVFFSERWAGYIQAGIDAVGFTRTLGTEQGYLGPAIGLGFGRVLGR
jgi:hypothetical protein